MTAYNPLFSRNRIWDIGEINFNLLARLWECDGFDLFIVKNEDNPPQRIIRMRNFENAGRDYFATETIYGRSEPRWEILDDGFWDRHIAPYIVKPPAIDLTGELDGDDIELAQIIMDELEEGK